MDRLARDLVFYPHAQKVRTPAAAGSPADPPALPKPRADPQRRHKKSIFRKLPKDFKLFRERKESGSFPAGSPEVREERGPGALRGFPRSVAEERLEAVVPESPGLSPRPTPRDDPSGCDLGLYDQALLENTRATEEMDPPSSLESLRPRPAKNLLNENLKRLVTFAEKFDVIFHLISESVAPDSGASHPNAIAVDILRLKFQENEKRDCDFSVLAHKMLAVDSSKYQIVKVGNYDRLGLEVRRLSRDGLFLMGNGSPISFRKFFKKQLVKMVGEFHAGFLRRIGSPAYDTESEGWHPAFSLDDFYQHLNYEPAETPEYRRAQELIRQRQEAISRNGEIAKERSAELRQKICRALQANEKSMTSSSLLDKDGRQVNAQIAPEIAIKLKLLFRIKRVSNMFLVNILKNFQNKAVFSLFVDEGELCDLIRYIGERVPQWLTLASNPGGTIVKINPDLDMESVVSQLKAGDG